MAVRGTGNCLDEDKRFSESAVQSPDSPGAAEKVMAKRPALNTLWMQGYVCTRKGLELAHIYRGKKGDGQVCTVENTVFQENGKNWALPQN